MWKERRGKIDEQRRQWRVLPLGWAQGGSPIVQDMVQGRVCRREREGKCNGDKPRVPKIADAPWLAQ